MVVTVTEPNSPAAESYRSLRTSLQFARQERQLSSLLVTSPGVGEGKTSTLANLGVVFAQAGERVLLVSCDLRRPRIGAFFGLDEQVGLTSVLLYEQTLEEAILPVPGIDRLSLLPAGPVPPNPAELLGSPRARDIFTLFRDQYRPGPDRQPAGTAGHRCRHLVPVRGRHAYARGGEARPAEPTCTAPSRNSARAAPPSWALS